MTHTFPRFAAVVLAFAMFALSWQSTLAVAAAPQGASACAVLA